MKILNASQLSNVDQCTIKSEPISSLDLMERAGNACGEYLTTHYAKDHKIAVICGTGNNGGDGLVIARLLRKAGYVLDVFVIENGGQRSKDFEANYLKISDVNSLHDAGNDVDFNVYTLLIDCLFGSGLNRPVVGLHAIIIEQMNASSSQVISIDMPSGLFVEDNHQNTGAIVHCHVCLTLELPKLSLLLPENKDFVEEFVVIPIGLHSECIDAQKTDYWYVDRDLVSKLLLPRSKYSHKGQFGHALMAVGSYGKMGAAVLATKSCLRSGAGLVTAYVPQCGYGIMQSTAPEAMVLTSSDDRILVDDIDTTTYTVGVGPGIGLHPDTGTFLQHLLRDTSTPTVIDADAINLLASNKVWIRYIPDHSILTPHPKELERLIGAWKNDADKFARVKLFCKNHTCYMVIKGAHTAIVDHTNTIYFNSTGNPGMATGGSGDVLTGIITSLLAQGYTSLHAAMLGVYLHGLAGDLAVQDLGQDSLIASDIIQYLGSAFIQLQSNGN